MELLIASFLAILHNPDTYGHLFYIFILIGTILLTKKKKYGWITRVVGDVGWVGIGYFIGMWSIVFWSGVFALNDFRGYLIWKWSEDENSIMQSEGKRTAKVLCPKDKGSIRPTRRGRSVKTDGKPRTRHNAKRKSPRTTSAFNRMQKHKNIPVTGSVRASKAQLKAIADALRNMEAPRKKLQPHDYLSKPRGLSKTDKGKK